MPASPSKKSATRQRILDAALPLFLEQGYDGVTIDKLMAAAKLTRGGFYAHFKSKQELFAELLRRDYGLPKKLRQARLGEMGPGIEPAHAMAYYLSPANREEISRDCPMASQTSDVRRAPEAVREAYTEHVLKTVNELQQHIPNRQAALTALATAVGALSISGALSDSTVADEIMQAASDQILSLFAAD